MIYVKKRVLFTLGGILVGEGEGDVVIVVDVVGVVMVVRVVFVVKS